MALTINGIVCQELVAEFTEGFNTQGGPTARKLLTCPWANRFQVAQGLLGLSNTTHVGGLINLLTPLPYPELPTMYAHNITIKGVGPPTQGTAQAQWPTALIAVDYQALPWTFPGLSYDIFNQIDPLHPYIWAEQNMSFTTEIITVPGQKVKWASSGKKLDQPWSFRSPLVNFVISLKSVPYLPAQEIINATQAPINSVTYLGVAAGYLLFNGAENHQTRMSDGTFTQSIDYSFSYRPIAPWDYAFNGDKAGGPPFWDQVVDLTGANIQQRSDISGIIPTYYDG